MKYNSFLDKAKQDLNQLSTDQLVHFALRMAFRTLPYLGYTGGLHFLPEKKREKFLYDIFYALDVTAAIYVENYSKKIEQLNGLYGRFVAKSKDVTNYTKIATRRAKSDSQKKTKASEAKISFKNEAIKIQNTTKSKMKEIKTAISLLKVEVKDAAYSAVEAAHKVDEIIAQLEWIYYPNVIIEETKNDLKDTIENVLQTCATASFTAAYAASRIASIDLFGSDRLYNINDISTVTEINEAFIPIIIKDLQIVKMGKGKVSIEETAFLENIWERFNQALNDAECGYWWKLYKGIIDSGFKFNKKDVETRIYVPKEIKARGAVAVSKLLESIKRNDVIRLNEARILILGDKGSGKTCIARKLVDINSPMTKDEDSTAGVDIFKWKIKDENLNINIWDFAGHTITHAAHQFFMSERCLYLIVYDGRTEERNRLTYWLDHMKNFGGDSKAIILVNRRDDHYVDIPINTLRDRYPIIGLYSFSIKNDNSDLLAFRDDVINYIKTNPSWKKQEIPIYYYQIKEELEKLFCNDKWGRDQELIKIDDFKRIAKKYNVDNIEELINNLHCLGICLWYKDMRGFNNLILNPEWISYGVYKIVNWSKEKKKYTLSLADFQLVFQDDNIRYPSDKYEFLFNLMIRYELAYETKNTKSLVIPHLLDEDRPEELPKFDVGESLMLRYKSDNPLPPNTVSRLIVRHNQDIKIADKKSLVWRYGVILDNGIGEIAMVREEDRSISISVKGPQKTKYLSILRDTLNDIFKSYLSKKPELEYWIQGYGAIPMDKESNNDLWLSDHKIINHYKRGMSYYDDTLDRHIPMGQIINNYDIKAENAIIAGQENKIVKTSFNFHNCNINLQGNLNDLAQLLKEKGDNDDAIELEKTSKLLEQIENQNNKDEIVKTGFLNRLKRIVEDLGDEDSKLHKTVKGIKTGIGIAQDIAKAYNDIAQWAALPQVPKPFLK